MNELKPTWCTIPSLYVYFYSVHVSGNYVPIIRRNNCINTTPGICHSETIKKSSPVTGLEWPRGFHRKLRFPDFMTTAQDGGKVVSLTYRPPLPQEILLVLISIRS
jgi:hypothetical protein